MEGWKILMERSLGNKQNTVRKESRKKEKRKVKKYVEKEDSTYTKSKTGSKILNMKLRKHKRRVKW